MKKLKIKKIDHHFKYKRVLEISTIAALVVVILLFKFFPNLEGKNITREDTQELFTVEDIVNTKQEQLPPPPPKPPIPIAAIVDDILEDIEIHSTELDVDEFVQAPPPPKDDRGTRTVEPEPEFFVAVEEMPEPIGGIAAIQKKISYPEIAVRAGVEGRVYILAYVNENGDVVKAEIVKDIGAGCGDAAITAVLATKFKPGKQRGKAVKVKINIPIKFELNKSS